MVGCEVTWGEVMWLVATCHVMSCEYPTKLWHDQSSLEWTCRLQEFTKPS